MLCQKFTAVCAVLLTLPLSVAARKKKAAMPASATPAVAQISPDEQVLHALSRLTFGAGPGDVDRVKQTGLSRWIEQQLNPESIPQNAVLEAKLAPLETLGMSSSELVQKYPPPQAIRAMVMGKQPWPEDIETRHMVHKMVAKYEQKLASEGSALPVAAATRPAALRLEEQRVLDNGTVPEKVAMLAALPVERQFDVLDVIPEGQRRRLFIAAPADVRRRIEMFNGTQTVVNQDLFAGKLQRAVYSDRQLEEVLTDFWYNHFNVYLDKGADRYMVTAYERDAIRPHVLGRFKDLLRATAESPAMLFYLDNFQSVGPEANKNPKAKRRNGLNENYGRELMELHTLGVDGGYTQQDVTEVARCFTGWTIREPRRGGGFEFRERQHDKGEKHVLGVTIPAGGGMDDGLRVIDLLARHPATARFISRSLAIRFVADDPPEALVARMAAAFQQTDGDLREVLRAMLTAPEFWSPVVYRAKLKSPFEMVVSSLRATNANVDFTTALAQQLNTLGEPLYRKQEPTGYSNKGAEWMNSASLLARMNFALALANNKIPGVTVEIPEGTPAQIEAKLLRFELPDASRKAIDAGLAQQSGQPNSPPEKALAAGLTLGSPEFQRR
jgi:uncharacterized protein (DUF1800 family)